MRDGNAQVSVGTSSTGTDAGAESVPKLLVKLASDRWIDRWSAEEELRKFGAPAIPALIDALDSSSTQVRWGAAKVLGEIGDEAAAERFVAMLEDVDGGIRWLAAQGLVRFGRASLIPLLRRLLARADSPWLQEGAHHVLRGLANPTVSPVIVALEGHYPALTVPVAANEALKELEAAP